MRPDDPAAYEIEYRVVPPDGSLRWVFAKGASQFGGAEPARTLLGFAGTIADITERKQGEELLRKNHDTFVSLVENAPFGLYVVDAKFRVRQMSAAARKVFIRVEPLIGRDFAEVVRAVWPLPFAAEVIAHFRNTLETGEAYSAPIVTEQRVDIEQLESYDWKIDRITLPDGQFGVACYFYDVSAQKEAQEVLREADRRKSEFLATLAHELRNPLAPLGNGLELLAITPRDQGTWEKAHGMMTRQMEQMVRLIDELMDLSRITRGTVDLQMERVDLRTIVDRAVEMSRPLIDRQGHALLLELPEAALIVDADSMRLTQVFTNLLNNAAKYTDRGGVITVRANAEQEEVRLTVEDNGIGIAPDQIGRVFDMFAQVERSNARVQGGLGIGLNIVKHLVGMHGGRIEVRSDGLGTGSSFEVSLPLATDRAQGGTASAVANQRAKAAPIRILIVDDNEDAAAMMALLLGTLGHVVRVANNGEQALATGAEMVPNLVLMDIGMPVLDGHAACRLMRNTLWGKAAFIVALTGWGQAEDRRKSADAGFDHHLVKPVASEALVAVIAAVK